MQVNSEVKYIQGTQQTPSHQQTLTTLPIQQLIGKIEGSSNSSCNFMEPTTLHF